MFLVYLIVFILGAPEISSPYGQGPPNKENKSNFIKMVKVLFRTLNDVI